MLCVTVDMSCAYAQGRPACGKSTFVSMLQSRLSYYSIGNTDWDAPFAPDRFKMAIAEEFRGGKTLQWMKLWLGGSPIDLNVKTSGIVHKPKGQLPTIVLSNLPPQQTFKNTNGTMDFRAMLDRLTVVCVPDNYFIPWTTMFSTWEEHAPLLARMPTTGATATCGAPAAADPPSSPITTAAPMVTEWPLAPPPSNQSE